MQFLLLVKENKTTATLIMHVVTFCSRISYAMFHHSLHEAKCLSPEYNCSQF